MKENRCFVKAVHKKLMQLFRCPIIPVMKKTVPPGGLLCLWQHRISAREGGLIADEFSGKVPCTFWQKKYCDRESEVTFSRQNIEAHICYCPHTA
jgi:hypothetical protein